MCGFKFKEEGNEGNLSRWMKRPFGCAPPVVVRRQSLVGFFFGV